MDQVKVRFESNGLETVMNENVAAIYEKKGKVKILSKIKNENGKEGGKEKAGKEGGEK